MKTIKLYILGILSMLLMHSAIAQRAVPEDAKEHFKYGNYIDALKVYVKLMDKDPKNIEYPYKAGLCVLFTERDKTDAIKYLEKADERKSDPDVKFYLGKAYHYNLKLDEALDAFNKYIAEGQGTKIHEVDREMQMVKNAKKMLQSPIDVTFENAGDNINSEYPDYYPFVTPNESFMVFTSRRKSGIREFDGYYPSAINYSKVVNGEFSAAKKGNSMINSTYDDQAVGLSYNADKLYIYFDDIKNKGDIYEASIKDFKFKKKIKMGDNVNSKGFESAATISADGNTLFFASHREGGLGGKDIYMTRKLPNGEWALPQNLGENINTKYDEDFPNLFYDGTTLYFSSKGHNSMGGYDYFKSTWDPETNKWSKAENLGYPLNTTRDNLCISFTEDKRHAYVSTRRRDSKGFQDIYKVTFNEIDSRETIIKSKIIEMGSTEAINDAFVIITNDRTQEERHYTPSSKNGGLLITLLPGSYTVMIDAPGYAPLNENLVIKGKSDFIPFMSKEFTLTK
ncbi:MAG: PD40 domain-containing protein [Flavobacteriales bacterium]|nr:PD40 domain-containing protein [Flavobacteriales bacterium]